MSIVQFLLLLVIAAIAAGAQAMITRVWDSLTFVARMVAYSLLLVLPTLLPGLLGG
jgi:hypothetical protein